MSSVMAAQIIKTPQWVFSILCVLAALLCFIGQMAGAATAIYTVGSEYAVLFTGLFGILAAIPILVFLNRYENKFQLLGERLTWKKLLFWLAVTILLLAFQYGYRTLLDSGTEQALINQAREFQSSSLGKKMMTVIAFGFLAPVVEEIVFRHLLLNAFPLWRSRNWMLVAVMVSGLLFALAHMQYLKATTFFLIMIMAATFCAARIHTRGLLTPMLMHMTLNCLACIEMGYVDLATLT